MFLASSGDGSIKLWNAKEDEAKRKLKHAVYHPDVGTNCLDIDYDCTKFVAGCMDHCLRVYDAIEMKEVITYKGEDTKHSEHFNRIYSIKFDESNDNVFYSGGWDKSITVHDIREAHSTSQFMGPYISGDSLDIFGDILLAGNYRSHDCLEMYDVKTGECVNTLNWTEDSDKTGGMIMACSYGIPKSDTVIAGSSSLHELKVFNPKDGSAYSTVTDFNGPVVAMDLTSEGDTISVGSKTGSVLLLKFSNPSEAE